MFVCLSYFSNKMLIVGASNNALRQSMKSLSVSASIASIIVDDPAVLRHPESIGMDNATATYILIHGFTKGFRSLFILHACLAVAATLTSVTMIKHKSLTRGDEVQLKQEGRRWSKKLRLDRALQKKGDIGKNKENAKGSKPSASGTSSDLEVDVELGEMEQKPSA